MIGGPNDERYRLNISSLDYTLVQPGNRLPQSTDVYIQVHKMNTYQQPAPETQSCNAVRKEERNCFFNNALNTFYLWLYGIRHMVKDHSDSERGNLLLPHGLLFLISSNSSFIYTILQTG